MLYMMTLLFRVRPFKFVSGTTEYSHVILDLVDRQLKMREKVEAYLA